MARFAPVAPIGLLEKLAEEGLLGDYHLLLTHEILEEQGRFKALFGPDSQYYDGPNRCVILDNSVVECGQPAPIRDLMEAADVVHPNIIVLPDHLGDFSKTVVSSLRGYDKLANITNTPFMWVVQGQTREELAHSAMIGYELPQVTCLGVPKIITRDLGSRMPIVQSIRYMSENIPIHLLGFSDDLEDDINCARMPLVQGIDSNVPIRLGQHDRGLDWAEESHKPRGDYFKTEQSKAHNVQVRRNLYDIRRRISQPRW